MKRLLILIALLAVGIQAHAAFVKEMPVKRVQPNGDTLRCYATGDEFYHRLHDANGYTIIQHPTTGYYVYATRQGSTLVATDLVAGIANPAHHGIPQGLTISLEEQELCHKRWDIPAQYQRNLPSPKTSGTNHGTFVNLVIFIRFADDNEIGTPLANINAMYNDSTSTSTSLYNYFRTVSLGKIRIPTYYAPTPNGDRVRSYQDIYNRNYFIPFNAVTNPEGYHQGGQAEREFGLIERAVRYVNDSFPIPEDQLLDGDGDGFIDNVTFILKGSYTGWNDLLWPHKWNLYDRALYINGKRISTFNLLLEGAGDNYFGSSTFCHEMFHTLGAPDLYRYYTGTNTSPVANWDLMGSNATPPQHMSAYMKYKYGNWIDSIPTITEPGVYSIHAGGCGDYSNIAYRIPSSHPNQFFMIEYRNTELPFESGIPGTGLLIYRVDNRYNGNAGYNGYSSFDELYLYRPGGDNENNGTPSQAHFRYGTGRTNFYYATNPAPILTDGTIDSTLLIFDISQAGETISFVYDNPNGCPIPHSLDVDSVSGTAAHLSWNSTSNDFTIIYYPANNPNDIHYVSFSDTTQTGRHHTLISGLETFTEYYCAVKSRCSDSDSSNSSRTAKFHTHACSTPIVSGLETISGSTPNLPMAVNTSYSYTQQLFTAEEMDTARTITSFALHYSHTEPMSHKDNCEVYMGHTPKQQFLTAKDSSFVPLDSLTLVYSGHLNCEQGWNTFDMNRPFHYNGTDNVVFAILDRSGHYEHQAYKFSYQKTDSTYIALSRLNRTQPVDPTVSGNNDDFNIMKRRSVIRFFGCEEDVYVVATQVAWLDTLEHTDSQAKVLGSGLYLDNHTVTLTATPLGENCTFRQWSDGSTENPRQCVIHSDTLFTALFFQETIGIDQPTEVPSSALIAVSHNRMQIIGAEGQPIRIFDTMGRLIAHSKNNHTFFLPKPGIYLVQIAHQPTQKIAVIY